MTEAITKTPCGGELNLKVNDDLFVGKYSGLKPSETACHKCPFKNFCASRFVPKTVNNKLPVFAFTGMKVGDLDIVAEREEELDVITAKGAVLTFNKNTGIQTNCKNPRFANRIN